MENMKKPKKIMLSRNEARTILAVFGKLRQMGYDKMNTLLGSATITEMEALYGKIRRQYTADVKRRKRE